MHVHHTPASKGDMTAPYTDLLTACAVVHNEEKLIERCIRSVKRVTDNMIIVHNGSCTDQTIEICRSLGYTVHEKPLMGLCGEEHRIAAYSIVETPWILQIDADEFLSEELIQHMGAMLHDDGVACYELLWPYWDGSRYRTKNWPQKKALFRRDRIHCLAFPHAEVRPNGTIKRVPYRLEHRPLYDNYSVASLKAKHKRWRKIQAAYYLTDPSELERYPPTASNLKPHYYAIGRFPLLVAPIIFCYHLAGLLMLGGLRAGWYGIRNSVAQSAYYFMLCIEVFRQKRDTKAARIGVRNGII